MIATPWNRFHWNVTSLPEQPLLKDPFFVRRALVEEKNAVKNLLLYALRMNTDWHDATDEVAGLIHQGVEYSFSREQEPSCFVIAHGTHLVGASIVDLRPEAEFQLCGGPWVLAEYRNRGFGTALLYASLKELADHGMTDAYGLTRSNSAAAAFVYPKFGATTSDAPVPQFLKKK